MNFYDLRRMLKHNLAPLCEAAGAGAAMLLLPATLMDLVWGTNFLDLLSPAALVLAIAGLPLLLAPSLALVAIGLALVGVGTFFAQATTTGFIGRAATADRGSASGLYLASYFLGGLAGAALLGQLFDRYGWAACVAGIGAALGAAVLLAARLHTMEKPNERSAPVFGSAR